MSLLSRIAPHLPYLRRYARLLYADSAIGDDAVRSLLDALSKAQVQLDNKFTPRVALYRALSSAFPTTEHGSVEHLSRQSYILITLEGFTEIEAGSILGLTALEVRQLSDNYIKTSLAGKPASVLIVEPQAIIAADLANIVQSLGHRVSEIATTADAAYRSAMQTPPDLVISETMLADGSLGTDAVLRILRHQTVASIFITDFPEKLITEDRPEPTFLISKPFNVETVRAAITQSLLSH